MPSYVDFIVVHGACMLICQHMQNMISQDKRQYWLLERSVALMMECVQNQKNINYVNIKTLDKVCVQQNILKTGDISQIL